MTEKLKVYEEKGKKSLPIWAWLLPLLLLLLLAIWLFSRNRSEGTNATATPVSDQTKPDATANSQRASAWTAASIADSIRSNGRVGFSDGDVHFATGSATLAADSQAVLDQAAQALKNNADWKMRVVGHTDSTGSSSTNQQLGQQRATAVMAYLVAHGVDQSRLSVDTQGEQQPASSNATDAGRAENRRVELVKQ
jgi:outer membrane protein OmpA-like peptidoglycan-associated protein